MDISEIELIQCINETGSLSQACKVLYMSQPTLSKKLSRLEQKLGAQLFYRYPKGLVATETAKFILSKSPSLREQLSEIERQVELMNKLESGQLNLGVGPIIEQILLPSVLEAFLDSTGGAKLSVITEDDEKLLEMFVASELDIIVGPFQAKHWGRIDIVAVPMVDDEIVAIARTDHPIFKEPQINKNALGNYPLISPKAQGTTKTPIVSSIVETQKIISDNYDLLKKLTLKTDAICAGPRAVFKDEIDNNQLTEISVPLLMNWESALLVRPETLVTPIAKHVVLLFEQVANSRQQN